MIKISISMHIKHTYHGAGEYFFKHARKTAVPI